MPTLVLVGDRDQFCAVEEGVRTCRSRPGAELAVVPGVDHVITAEKVAIAADFVQRRR